jgi:hypothetical protein
MGAEGHEDRDSCGSVLSGDHPRDASLSNLVEFRVALCRLTPHSRGQCWALRRVRRLGTFAGHPGARWRGGGLSWDWLAGIPGLDRSARWCASKTDTRAFFDKGCIRNPRTEVVQERTATVERPKAGVFNRRRRRHAGTNDAHQPSDATSRFLAGRHDSGLSWLSARRAGSGASRSARRTGWTGTAQAPTIRSSPAAGPSGTPVRSNLDARHRSECLTAACRTTHTASIIPGGPRPDEHPIVAPDGAWRSRRAWGRRRGATAHRQLPHRRDATSVRPTTPNSRRALRTSCEKRERRESTG